MAFKEEDGFGESVFVVVLGQVVAMVVGVEKRRVRVREAIAEEEEEREENDDSEGI